MNLETFFSEADINEIYNTTIIYSILKYQTLPQIWKEEFKDRYEFANQLVIERNINPHIIQNSNLDDLKERLTEYEIIYRTNIELNRPTVEQIGSDITRLVIHTINQETNEIDKISYLFDFITSYLTYSEDYNKYCLNVPPIDGFAFDFKNNIPIEPSINGTLVMGQGLCSDISNALQYLGQFLNLKIATITCNYKEIPHRLNIITLSDGNTYLIDATRLIKKDKTKGECFLASANDLNKDNNYEFKDNLPITTTYKHNVPNYYIQVTELLNNINEIKPQIKDLNNNTKINLR